MSIAREVVAVGTDAAKVADELVEKLRGPGLQLAVVFADARLDPAVIASVTGRALGPAPVVGCSTRGVVTRLAQVGREPAAVALGLYGDWLRVGIGVVPELSRSPLIRSRDAMHAAAAMLGTTAAELEAGRHVAFGLCDGRSTHQDSFCIGSAAGAVQLRVVGGSSSSEFTSRVPTPIWVNGEAMTEAGVIVVLESTRPIRVVTSAHLVPTDVRAVVTAASGRAVEELDGFPAASRLGQLVAHIAGGAPEDSYPVEFAFARYIDGVPYVRSIMDVDGQRLVLAGAVEAGHVLRVMRPGDLIGTTRADLAAAAQAVGGTVSALLAFSCASRHVEAMARRQEAKLAAEYAQYPVIGLQTYGEQIGMVLVNHTLTGLVIA